MMSLKNNQKSAKSETLKLLVFFFALAGERIFIKLHSIEIRLYRAGVYIYTCAGESVHLSAGKFYRLGQ